MRLWKLAKRYLFIWVVISRTRLVTSLNFPWVESIDRWFKAWCRSLFCLRFHIIMARSWSSRFILFSTDSLKSWPSWPILFIDPFLNIVASWSRRVCWFWFHLLDVVISIAFITEVICWYGWWIDFSWSSEHWHLQRFFRSIFVHCFVFGTKFIRARSWIIFDRVGEPLAFGLEHRVHFIMGESLNIFILNHKHPIIIDDVLDLLFLLFFGFGFHTSFEFGSGTERCVTFGAILLPMRVVLNWVREEVQGDGLVVTGKSVFLLPSRKNDINNNFITIKVVFIHLWLPHLSSMNSQ